MLASTAAQASVALLRIGVGAVFLWAAIEKLLGPGGQVEAFLKYGTNGTLGWPFLPTAVLAGTEFNPTHALWAGIEDGSWFYFVHSFYARTSDAHHSVGEAHYGARFTAAIARDNIFATQFHPEKSADHGLALYRNFLQWNP